jgi:DNA invertase Pin-like site-specific DNA recombinase
MEENMDLQDSGRIFGYTRVSTTEQDVDSQVRELKKSGVKPENIYADDGVSGTVSAKKRKAFKKLYDIILEGKVDKLYVFELSRLGRDASETLILFAEIELMNCKVISLSESEKWTRITDIPGIRNIFVAIFTWMADNERKQISERTKAAMKKAKEDGKQIGRPRRKIDRDSYNKYKKMGLKITEISRLMDVPIGTMHRYVDAWEEEERIEHNRMV